MVLLFFSCAKELNQDDRKVSTSESELISFDDIKKKVEQNLSEGKILYWDDQSTDFIYSAAMHSDSFLSIGYTIDKNFNIQEKMGSFSMEDPAWVDARKEVESIILKYTQAATSKSVTMRDLEPYGQQKNVPQIIIQSANKDLYEALRQHPKVRFIEPLGFSITDKVAIQRSDSGCSGNPDYNINSDDYTSVSPPASRSWHLDHHNVTTAWNNSSKGRGVKACIIDTGASFDQDNLNGSFNSGNSYGRTIEKYSTKYSGSWWWRTLDSPNDPCGHGTSMIGFAGAPWSNDGNIIGAAYQSNIISIRGVEDVVISTSNERKGVRDALILGTNKQAKIISMSIGSPFYSSTVADGIYYANNAGVLMFAAAGTSFSWSSWYPVIFPATMNETRAVTGVKDTESLQKCTVCHSGSQVDFVIVMERNADHDRVALSLALTTDQPKYVGGSSCATATTAGIATMLWAENPGASREQIVQALKEASSEYPNRHSKLGWGKIDAAAALNNL